MSYNKHVYTPLNSQSRPITHAISKIEPFFLSLENGSFLEILVEFTNHVASIASIPPFIIPQLWCIFNRRGSIAICLFPNCNVRLLGGGGEETLMICLFSSSFLPFLLEIVNDFEIVGIFRIVGILSWILWHFVSSFSYRGFEIKKKC